MEREGERQREKGRDKAQGGGGGGGERQRQRPNNRACLTSITPLLPQAVQLTFYGTKADLVVQFLGRGAAYYITSTQQRCSAHARLFERMNESPSVLTSYPTHRDLISSELRLHFEEL